MTWYTPTEGAAWNITAPAFTMDGVDLMPNAAVTPASTDPMVVEF